MKLLRKLRNSQQVCYTETRTLVPKWPTEARLAELICAAEHDDLLEFGNTNQMVNMLTASNVH